MRAAEWCNAEIRAAFRQGRELGTSGGTAHLMTCEVCDSTLQGAAPAIGDGVVHPAGAEHLERDQSGRSRAKGG
jgi:hypothetical protein